MYKILIAAIILAVAVIASADAAQAQSADGLGEAMRQSVARCEGNQYDSDSTVKQVYINSHCVKVHFHTLQSYVDAANRCINAGSTVPPDSTACREAQIIEKSLIRTFQPPKPATARR